MKVSIQRNQIHHFTSEILDDNGNPTGERESVLQFDIKFTEHPDLPTYGRRIDLTSITTKEQLKEAIKQEILDKVEKVKTQIQDDGIVRQHFEDWNWLVEFDTDSL